MKNQTGILCLFAVLILTGAACSDDDGPTNNGTTGNPYGADISFRIDGDGYDNELITFAFGAASYEVEDNATGIAGVQDTNLIRNLDLDSQHDQLAILVSGKNTGSFPWDIESSGVLIRLNSKIYYIVEGSTVIQAYGAVGTFVDGSFSGQMVDPDTGEFVTISEGNFTVRRLADDFFKEETSAEIGENSFTLNGGDFSNRNVQLESPEAANAFKFDNDQTTVNVAADMTSDPVITNVTVTISFFGQIGTHSIGSLNTVTIGFDAGESLFLSSLNGAILVDTYDEVGGLVEGRFEGNFIETGSGQQYEISNGHFSAERRQ